MVSSVRSREETRFLALLVKTQERASNIGQRKKKVRQNKPEDRQQKVIQEGRQSIVDNEDRTNNGEESGEEEVDWRLPKVNKDQQLLQFSLILRSFSLFSSHYHLSNNWIDLILP
jgi:hypothetical protein